MQVSVPQTEASPADNPSSDTKEPAKVVLTLSVILHPSIHDCRLLHALIWSQLLCFHCHFLSRPSNGVPTQKVWIWKKKNYFQNYLCY